MDPENDADRSRDTETNTSQTMTSGKAPETSAPTLPRAMSIDPPESTALSNGSAQRKRWFRVVDESKITNIASQSLLLF